MQKRGKPHKKAPRGRKLGSKKTLSPPSSDSDDSDYGPGKEEESLEVAKGKRRRSQSCRAQNDEALYFLSKSKPKTELERDYGVNLWLILKPVEPNDHRDVFPAEILIKIIKYSVEFSDNPLFQLLNCSQVSEHWREIVIYSSDLWSRLDLTHLPQTSRNLATLEKIFKLNPNIARSIKRLDLEGWNMNKSVFPLLNGIISHQKLEHLGLKAVNSTNKGIFFDTISKASTLKSIVINNSKELLHTNQNWISQHLNNHGSNLEKLDLNLSLHSINPNLFRAICSPLCANLKVLDLSTGVYINQGNSGLDATLLANNLPNLEILRCAVTSFKRVVDPPRVVGLLKLKELSIPTLIPDQDRDDSLFGTLAFGSMDLEYLDLRGAVISTYALVSLPSSNVNNLHLDDLASNIVRNYRVIIEKWVHNLECLSLLRVNNKDAIDECMEIIAQEERPKFRAIDLSGSDVSLEGLKLFLGSCKNLEAINLNSCRCLPRGFKGSYSSSVKSNRLSIATLRTKVQGEVTSTR